MTLKGEEMKAAHNPVQRRLHEFVVLRWVCRGVVLLTAGVSVWANELHAQGGGPSMVIAAIPPVFALGAWELVSRIPMRPQRSRFRTLVRALRPIATAGLFGGAAWLSYWHQKSAVLRYSNFDQSAANIIPLLIDGLMIVTSVSIFEVNERINELQAHLGGVGRDISREPKPEPARRRKATGRERVANILAKNPTISVSDLARLAEVSNAYAYTLAKELRSANGAELVDAS